MPEEFIEFIVNVEAAIFKADRWLMIQRSEKESHAAGTISMVGGKVEKVEGNNILEETLRREIMEEVGIEVGDTLDYIESKAFLAGNGKAVIDVVFLCEHKIGEPRIVSRDEVADIFWMSIDEILNHPKTPPWLKQSIKLAENMRQNQRSQ